MTEHYELRPRAHVTPSPSHSWILSAARSPRLPFSRRIIRPITLCLNIYRAALGKHEPSLCMGAQHVGSPSLSRALCNQPHQAATSPVHTVYRGLPLSISSSSVSIPDHGHRRTPTVSAHRRSEHRGRRPTRTHAHRPAVYREPETKFSATSPPSMLPITWCSRYEIERPRRFSTAAVTPCAILRSE